MKEQSELLVISEESDESSISSDVDIEVLENEAEKILALVSKPTSSGIYPITGDNETVREEMKLSNERRPKFNIMKQMADDSDELHDAEVLQISSDDYWVSLSE